MKRQFLGNIYRDQSSVLAFVNIFPNTLYLNGVGVPWGLGALGSFIARLAFGFSWTLLTPWSLSTPMSLELPWGPEALGFLVSLCHLCLHVVLWILANRESPQCLLAPRVQGLPAWNSWRAKAGAITTRPICWKLLSPQHVQRKQRFYFILMIDTST